MSNALRKLEKNQFKNVPVYTEEQFKNKVKQIEDDLKVQYKDKVRRIADESLKQIDEKSYENRKAFYVEFFYELANQMGMFNDDCDYKDDIKDRIIEMYNNIMLSLKTYKKYKHPEKELKKKQNLIEKEFNVKF